MAGETNVETTTTTRTTTQTTASIVIDVGWIVPHGILKIIEIIFCIVVLACVASKRTGSCIDLCTSYFCSYGCSYFHGTGFPLAIACIFFISTLVFFIIFLLNLPERLCGRKICCMVDAGFSAVAVLTFLISFILLCIYANTSTWTSGLMNVTIDALIVAAIFALILAVLYALSIFFTFKGRVAMISVKT